MSDPIEIADGYAAEPYSDGGFLIRGKPGEWFAAPRHMAMAAAVREIVRLREQCVDLKRSILNDHLARRNEDKRNEARAEVDAKTAEIISLREQISVLNETVQRHRDIIGEMQTEYANRAPLDIVTRLQALSADHGPDGWPAVQMRDITALCAKVTELHEENQVLNDIIQGWRERFDDA